MSHPSQTILIIDQSTELVDTLFDLLNEASLPNIRVFPSFSLRDARARLKERTFSLVIARIPRNKEDRFERFIRQNLPMPFIGIMAASDGATLYSMLRMGATDLFPLRGFSNQSTDFIRSVERCLSQARMVDENRFYREELEHSLAELRADQQAAYHVQRSMMPADSMEVCGIRARHLIQPSLYLSGDFVDMVPVDESKVVFYLADVSGHGASSALVTVLLKNMTQSMVRDYKALPARQQPTLTDILLRVNRELIETGVGKHLSMFIGAIDRKHGRLHYAVGGHHPMPLLTDENGTRYLEGRGMAVGLFEQPVFDERTIELSCPFQVTLFSDGVLEVLPHRSMLAREEYVRGVVDNLRGAPPEKLRDTLLSNFRGEAPDDITIMTVIGQ